MAASMWNPEASPRSSARRPNYLPRRRRGCHHRGHRRQRAAGGGAFARAAAARRADHPADPGQHRRFAGGAARADEAGCRADVDVAEMDNYPFSCWRLGPTRIRPIVKKRWLQIASFPGPHRLGVPASGAAVPPCHRSADVIYTGFTNANAMLHVANWSVMRARSIEGRATVLRRGCDAIGRSTLWGDQCRTRGGGRRVWCVGADAG